MLDLAYPCKISHIWTNAHVELDLDGDGQWERSYRPDRYDEPVMEADE